MFGPNIKSVAIYFLVQQVIPFARTQEILMDLYGIWISQGTLSNFINQVGDALQSWRQEAKVELSQATILNVDDRVI